MTPAAAAPTPTAGPEAVPADEWTRLVAARPGATPFSGPLVQMAHAGAFGPLPVTLALRHGGDLLSVWPLVTRSLKAGPLSVSELGFTRNAHTLRNDLLLPAAGQTEALAALFAAAARLPGWQTLALDNIVAEPGLATAIPTAARAAGLPADAPAPGRHLLHADIDADFDAYLATRSGQFRRQLKKRERELAALGPVGIRSLQGAEIVGAWADWQQVCAASWQGASPEASALGADDWAFHRALTACGRLWLLHVGERPVAALRMLEDADTAYVHTMHFDRALADHAPGLVLFAAMMRDACQRRLRRVDFNGNSPFFARWSTGETAHLNWRLYRPGLSGRIARLSRRGLHLLRKPAAPPAEAVPE